MTTATQPPRSYEATTSEPRSAPRVGPPTRGFDHNGGRRETSPDEIEQLARGLGWFSIGLGLSQLAAPRSVARLIGASESQGTRTLMAALGVRELISGVGILRQPDSAGWVWARVAGDLMDLALLRSARDARSSHRGRIAAATLAVVGVTALDAFAARELSRGNGAAGPRAAASRGVRAAAAATISRSPEEVYQFWRRLENLPRFMAHLESVRVTDDRRSHWKAKAPAGAIVEWDAEITEDRPNELIAWRSAEGADVPNFGSVRFTPAPGDRGTEVRVELRYDPPGGVVGATIAKLFGEEPGEQARGDLRRFKQVMETGEVVHSDASIHTGTHPAQPSNETA